MTIDERNARMMDGEELFGDLEKLKAHIMYADDFMELPKDRQKEIYKFCKRNAESECCRENLKQIRFVAARLYFGF